LFRHHYHFDSKDGIVHFLFCSDETIGKYDVYDAMYVINASTFKCVQLDLVNANLKVILRR
jgi:hypothetical protein